MLRRFQDAGHVAVALAGGATGMIGDPSGRSDERNLLDDETLDRNVAAIKAQIERIVDLSDGRGRLVDNRDWTAPITVLEFLREVGKHATVNQMLARESVRTRLESEQGISFTEFSYMLLQANDYLWLHDHLGCELQIGGSDQWGNIVSGVDLIRRKRQAGVHALAWPLLTGADGSKLGKTSGARVWLDPQKTSPYRFHQHWMQLDDGELERQFLVFSLRSREEIAAILAEHATAPERRRGQRALADEVTALVHGADAATAAGEAADVLFGADPLAASPAALDALAAEVPSSRSAASTRPRTCSWRPALPAPRASCADSWCRAACRPTAVGSSRVTGSGTCPCCTAAGCCCARASGPTTWWRFSRSQVDGPHQRR